MLRKLLKSKIHRATVTRVDIDYQGSLAVDEDLCDAAGFLPHEAVHVWNVTNGQRLQTYVIPAPRGSGEICVNGAAARLAQTGDIIIIATFAWMDEVDARGYEPEVVLVDGRNRVLRG